ncbi:MAG: hypothetical protein E7041_05220 [Lentisphaerae bacterium]|nr:hypothetical protein [Lentisphaerota bacterium]
MKKIRVWYAVVMLTAAAVCGCSSAPKESKQRIGLGKPDGYEKYEKISAADLYFNMVSKPVLYAGEDGTLVFALRNGGSRSVEIREWLRNESENVKIMIQPYLPDMKAPDPQGWIELVEPQKRPVIHYPLTLMPDNQAMVSKKLEFIRKMQVTAGMERRFFIKAQLTLKSLDLATEVMVLRVLPAKTMKGNAR